MIIDRRFLETQWWGLGPGASPTLVLLHEGLGCVGLWRAFPEALAAATGCGLFAYSRFGYGNSDPAPLPRPMGYMHDEALQVLPRVLDATGVRRCVLIGHSDGGSIAAIHAGTMGDSRVIGLVLIAAHFFVEDINIAAIRAIKAQYQQGELRARLARYHNDVDVAFHGWNDAWLDPRFRVFDVTNELAHIQVPLLALQGTDDPYGTEEQLRVLERSVCCSIETRLIAGARHAPHLEARQATLDAMVSFVSSLPLEGTA
jgi:pimeloyl-ACP methyl ester carboxylesterase